MIVTGHHKDMPIAAHDSFQLTAVGMRRSLTASVLVEHTQLVVVRDSPAVIIGYGLHHLRNNHSSHQGTAAFVPPSKAGTTQRQMSGRSAAVHTMHAEAEEGICTVPA